MDELLARNLSKKFRIAKEPIIREEYEMIFLRALLSSSFHKELIFKGGTALRLAYGSPRFSEDLDFSLRKEIKHRDFVEVVSATAKALPTVKVRELTEKRFTHFVLLQVKEPYLKQAFPIKIEVSKRLTEWREGRDFAAHVLKSSVVPLEAVGFVITLEKAFEDKERMIGERGKARDLFDLWWLGQKLDKRVELAFGDSEIKKIRAELNQFLPQPMRLVVESWRKG